MADRTRRLPQNIAGDFFVDDSCIDCDTCRQIAPAHFRDHGDQSSVYRQPETAAEISQALKALVCCPTASIGSLTKHDLRQTVASFPSLVAENVYFCGFTAESSYGAWSYLIARPDEAGGNVLVDSPRFAAPLVRRIKELGGVRIMFLTHRDDSITTQAKRCANICDVASSGCRRPGAYQTISCPPLISIVSP